MARASSMMKISGSTLIATEKVSRACMPLEYVLNGWSMTSPSSLKSMISSTLRSISCAAHAQAHPAHGDVLAAGVLGMEAGAELEDRRQAGR